MTKSDLQQMLDDISTAAEEAFEDVQAVLAESHEPTGGIALTVAISGPSSLAAARTARNVQDFFRSRLPNWMQGVTVFVSKIEIGNRAPMYFPAPGRKEKEEMKRTFKVGEWVRLKTDDMRLSDGLQARSGHAARIETEYDIHYNAYGVRLEGGDVLRLNVDRLEPLPFQPGDCVRGPRGLDYTLNHYAGASVILDSHEEPAGGSIYIYIDSLLADWEKVESKLKAETRMVRASNPGYFHFDGSTYRLADVNEAILAACPQIVPGTLVVTENYEKCSLSISCVVQRGYSIASVSLTKQHIKEALRDVLPAGIVLEFASIVEAPEAKLVSPLQPDNYTKKELENLKKKIYEQYKLAFPQVVLDICKQPPAFVGPEPGKTEPHHGYRRLHDMKPFEISASFEPPSVSFTKEEIAETQQAFNKMARAMAGYEAKPLTVRRLIADYRPCPRDGCHGSIYKVEGKDTPCKECGYPGLRPKETSMPFEPCLHPSDIDREIERSGGYASAASVSCQLPAVREGSGQLLKEQRRKAPYVSPLHETSFCWRCGHDRGCMHPRKEEA